MYIDVKFENREKGKERFRERDVDGQIDRKERKKQIRVKEIWKKMLIEIDRKKGN